MVILPQTSEVSKTSEVLNGFKQTEIGPIPVEWEVVRLGELCQLKRENVEPRELPEMPYVGLEHIESGEPKLRRWGSSNEVGSSKHHFVPGDVLYGKLRPYLDKAILAEFEGVCSTDIIVLKANANLTLPEFLVYFLHTRQFLSRAISTTTGTNLPRTRWTSLRDFELALPPLPEQHRIAHVLSTLQRAIAAQDDLIAAARELKRSLMQRLFTYGPGAEPAPTKETEVGPVPEHWEFQTLDEVKAPGKGTIVSGPFGSNIGKRFFVESGVPLIRGCNLTKGESLFLEEGFVYITEEKARELANCTALPGDLVFTAAGTIGQVGLIPAHCRYPKYVISNKQLRARVDTSRVEPLYLFYWFAHERMQDLIQKRRRGTSIPVINLGILRSLPVGIPNLSEQREIIDVLAATDCKIEAEEQRKAALEALFKTMLHQLMTGQVRLRELVEVL